MHTQRFEVGTEFDLRITAVAHGGHCVGRVSDEPHGRVVFVRHTIPGERVRVRVTEDGGGAFLRADAVQVLGQVPGRVEPPCPHAGPGRCGGCDWQHVDPQLQRRLKAEIVREQFQRLAAITLTPDMLGVDACGLDASGGELGQTEFGSAQELPGGPLGWRTRTRYAAGTDSRLGLHVHRSHEIYPLTQCPLGVAGVADNEVLTRSWPPHSELEVAADDEHIAVLMHTAARSRPAGRSRRRRAPDRAQQLSGPARLHYRVLDRDFVVSAGGFWQVHPAAASTFATAMMQALAPQPGERVLDLYAGAGLFTALVADRVAPTGSVVGIEADARAVADAQQNLSDLPWAQCKHASVSDTLIDDLGRFDLVLLDPPRSGAGAAVINAVLRAAPRKVGYLACDPAALARDVRSATEAGWRLTQVQIFDSFPMTQHIEVLAVLSPPDGLIYPDEPVGDLGGTMSVIAPRAMNE